MQKNTKNEKNAAQTVRAVGAAVHDHPPQDMCNPIVHENLPPFNTQSDRLLRAEQVAAILGVSRTHAYRLMREGAFPVCHFGPGTVRVRLSVIEDFVTRGGQP